MHLDNPHCALGVLRSCLGAPKMVYSLRCNAPSDESSVILQDFDNPQRTKYEKMLGTVIGDNAWKQACLPISKTGVGIRQAVDQLKAASHADDAAAWVSIARRRFSRANNR